MKLRGIFKKVLPFVVAAFPGFSGLIQGKLKVVQNESRVQLGCIVPK